MWKAAFGVLLLLYVTSLTSCAAECHKDGPESCFFQTGKTCSWSVENFDFNTQIPTIRYLELVPGKGTGYLTSRTACSTEGQTQCLWFAYRFSASDVSDLSVRFTVGDKAESLLWVSSSGNGWSEASIPINTTDNFRVIFRAKRLSGEYADYNSVDIDNIRYDSTPGGVQCKLQPSTALPRKPAVTRIHPSTTMPSITRTQASTTTPSITRTQAFTTMPSITRTQASTTTPSITRTQASTTTPSIARTQASTTMPSITRTQASKTTPSITRTHPSTSMPASIETAEHSNNTVTVAVSVLGVLAGILKIVVVFRCIVKRKDRRKDRGHGNDKYEMRSRKPELPDLILRQSEKQRESSTSEDEVRLLPF